MTTPRPECKTFHEFLVRERDNVLMLCAAKLLGVGGTRSSSPELERGLPTFYDELVEVLRCDALGGTNVPDQIESTVHREFAVRRGRESLQMGYTISQVVHGYGALCQAVTEFACLYYPQLIQAREFNRLNFCLDVAIAEAVTEFTRGAQETAAQAEVQRLGFLAHELRNALASATTAHHMIRTGMVGAGGSTNQVLEMAFARMEAIIDRSLAEVRLRGTPTLEQRSYRLVDVVGEVEATAMPQAAAKGIRLHVNVPPHLTVFADRHLVVSALSNLVQNGVKFTRTGGNVWVRCYARDERVLVEVVDECGGLPPGDPELLFRVYSQRGEDKSGVGLGLSISRRAVELNEGTVCAHDVPGEGCCFTIELPRFAPAAPLSAA